MNPQIQQLQEALAQVQQLGAQIVGDWEARDAALPECGPHTKALLADLQDEMHRRQAEAILHAPAIERLGQLCALLNPLMPERHAGLSVQIACGPLVYCTTTPQRGAAALQAAALAGITWKDGGPGFNDETRYIEFTGYEGKFAIQAAALDALPCAPQEAH